MRKLAEGVKEGNLVRPPKQLRDGDELQEFYATFRSMLETLRAKEQAELDALAEVAAKAKGDEAASEVLEALQRIQQAKRSRL
jgi:hypothetical protein